MKIDMIMVPVRDLIKGYVEDPDTSKVTAWNGQLDVRPEYQREYVYNDQQRSSVINTVLHKFPLNVMYFVDRGEGVQGARYEVLDGQQRIISICTFATNSAISVNLPSPTGTGFNAVNYPNLFDEQKAAFEDYKLQVYICQGSESEKISWFEIINIAGEKLEKQEIRNAVLHSAWLTDAKSLLSRRSGAAVRRYGKYFAGDWNRQKHLETAFRWAADAEGMQGKDDAVIRQYMMAHSGDATADRLWKYLEDVFAWVEATFGAFDKTMKGVDWGYLYNRHKGDLLDPQVIQARIAELMADDEVQRKAGIYEYLLTGEKKLLNLRTFSPRDKATMYARQEGLCALCGKPFDIKEMHADHIIPWSRGGITDLSNGQMLCTTCNLKKSDK